MAGELTINCQKNKRRPEAAENARSERGHLPLFSLCKYHRYWKRKTTVLDLTSKIPDGWRPEQPQYEHLWTFLLTYLRLEAGPWG